MSKKNKSKDKKGSNIRVELQSAILTILENDPGKAFTFKQLVKKLSLKKKDDIKIAGQIIDQLEEDERITQLADGSFKGKRSLQELTGIVDHVSSRFGYVKLGNEQPDIFIKGRDLGSAVDGDTVTITILPTRHGEHQEGKVTSIVKRNRTRFVGKVELSKNFAFVVPDYRKMHTDFFVYPEHVNGAKAGDKVIIEVISWAQDDKKPEAKIVEVLGKAGENEAEIHSIMAEFDLPFRFPEKVIAESKQIEEAISKEEIKKDGTSGRSRHLRSTRKMPRILTMQYLFESWIMVIMRLGFISQTLPTM